MRALPKELTQRIETLEKRRADPTAMSDLELARRIAFVRVSEGRDLLGEVMPARSLGQPQDSNRPAYRQQPRSDGSARSERLP